MSLLGRAYQVFFNGGLIEFDGASGSTPVMAAFVTLVNAQRKSHGLPTMGWINPFLYKYHASFINDITFGDNKCTLSFVQPTTPVETTSPYNFWNHTCCQEGFYATTGWDPVTGLGSVNFDKFLKTAMSVPSLNGFTPTATPTAKPTTRLPTAKPTVRPTTASVVKICQFGGYCVTASDCVAGNKCQVQSPYYSQCIADPTT